MGRDILNTVRLALAEDVGRGDVTSRLTVPVEARAIGHFVARQELTLAGLDAACAVFEELSQGMAHFTSAARDGDAIQAGARFASVTGTARDVLAGERVALNLLMRLSGIATLTRRYVSEIEGTGTRVVDTRKTTPGLRALEKEAVRAGGGINHRFALDDGILIKDNHIEIAGGVTEAVQRAKRSAPHLLKVEVEVESIRMLEEALTAGADVVLLDNMSPDEVRQSVAVVRAKSPGVVIEVSGGINLETVRAYAEAGADLISVGALTHSATAVDISLEIEPC